MVSPQPDPPSEPPRPGAPKPDPADRFSEQAEALLTEMARLLRRALPHLKAWNARVAAWAAEASWKRIALLGLVVAITSSIIGDILGLDEPTVVVTGNDKPIKIDIKEDATGVTFQPSVDGKPTKPTHVDLPKFDPPAPETKRRPAAPDQPSKEPEKGAIRLEKDGKQIIIDSQGVRVVDAEHPPEPVVPPIPGAPPAGAQSPTPPPGANGRPEKQDAEQIQAANEEAKAANEEAKAANEQAREERREEVRDAIEQAKSEIQDAVQSVIEENTKRTIVHRESAAFWDFFKILLTISFAYLIAIKVSTSNKRRADEMVKSASQVAEHESLRRQVLEARMQMMQAQVEPHFLFNTLSSVDYLIDTDPARASMMQKNLIQYLRAALPQMRESSTTIGREVDLVRAYLDILKVRMEERLQVSIDLPSGLRSADFPPMMLQSLVENAIKHGLEPKAEGGSIRIAAEVVDGDLYVTISDTGLGFNPAGAPTSGGGLGLANIRERLGLLYGSRAKFVITANEPSGTRVAIVIPYQPAPNRN
jgi:chemotaxis protein histidine kinase CheA